ncbi:MAG: carcinine hydrolase/isopenicillin-N N-acyltransferase family protein [Candidatus Cryptobacteroides sp.]
MKNLAKLFALPLLACSVILVSCTKENNVQSKSRKAAYIEDEAKLAMINSVKNLDGLGRLYEVDYTVDYKLDELIAKDAEGQAGLFTEIPKLLFDRQDPKPANVSFGAGCSAFAVPEAGGIDFLMGRNYDFRHADAKGYKPIAAILVRTAPEDGKKSIAMVDGANLGFGQGFYEDPDQDMSMLMGLPYAILDGINEDGFAIGVLALREVPTVQMDPSKHTIGTTVAMRMLLDKVSTVREAIEMLKQYNLDMSLAGIESIPEDGKKDPIGTGCVNYHYYMADATGDFAIIEYVFRKDASSETPIFMEVMQGGDENRYLTNFYVSDSMAERPEGKDKSTHGLNRYNILANTLYHAGYQLSKDDAMQLLNYVSQPPTEDFTSQTQWSSLYNCSQRKLSLAILREYGSVYNFRVE